MNGTFAADFQAAFTANDRGFNYVTLLAMRQALPQYTRAQFDAELRILRGAGGAPRLFTLDASDGRHVRMTEEERAAGIHEVGNNLVYVARRAT